MLAGVQQQTEAELWADRLQVALASAITAASLSGYGDYDAVKEKFLESAPNDMKKRGRKHRSTLSTLNNLGVLYVRFAHLENAELVQLEGLNTDIEKYGMGNGQLSSRLSSKDRAC